MNPFETRELTDEEKNEQRRSMCLQLALQYLTANTDDHQHAIDSTGDEALGLARKFAFYLKNG